MTSSDKGVYSTEFFAFDAPLSHLYFSFFFSSKQITAYEMSRAYCW